MRNLLVLLSLVLTACTSGAGGGSSGYCYSDGPLASNLLLTPGSAIVGDGGGSVSVDLTFDYRSRSGAKIFLVKYRVEDASGKKLVDSNIEKNLKGRGAFTVSVPIATQSAASYTVGVRLLDECFAQSNWLEATFDVLAVAALAGKTGYATVHSDSYVYFIGGRDDNGQLSDMLLQYDPASARSDRKAPMPEGREFAAAAATDDVVYVFGGSAFGFGQESTFAYNPATDTWTAVTPMPEPLAGARASLIDGMIYIEGGNGVHRYDPVLDLWTGISRREP